ncbi:MAG: DNA repair exonuclease [Sulfolobales archaeon]
MAKVLFLHVSDTHLGSSKPLSGSKARELDFYDVFDEVVDIAVRERVDAVIHCGDLFDNYEPSPRAYYHTVKSLKKLSAAGIPFLVIAGGHDQPKRAEMSPLKVLEEVGVAKALAISEPATHVVSLRSGELGITAVPYSPPNAFSGWIGRLKRPEAGRKILVAHMMLKELNLPESHASLDELKAVEYDYVALGHYHMKYSIRRNSTPIVYPGSTEAQDRREASDERFVALVDLSTREAVVSWVKLSRFRRFVIVEGVRDLGDLDRRLAKLVTGVDEKPAILYVEFSEPVKRWDGVRSRLNELVRRGVILNYKLSAPGIAESEERVYEDLSEAPLSLESVVYEASGDPEVAELLLEIIRNSGNREAVEKIVNELLERERLVEKIEKLVRKK